MSLRGPDAEKNTHPQSIQLYLNLTCGYRCEFCFNRGLSETGAIGPGEFSSLIGILKKIGVNSIDILGGEPTLHPHLPEFAAMINENNLSTTISTNGSNIDMLRRISKAYAGEANIKIGVSINDAVNMALDEFIIECKPYVKSVATKAAPIPEAAVRYIGHAGINYYLIFMDAVVARDLQKTLPFYEYYDILNALKSANSGVEGVYCAGFLPDAENSRCPAGSTKMAVLPDGSVYPCNLFFRYGQFRLGNIYIDNFDTIWGNPVLSYFRQFKGNTCLQRDCKLFSRCRGGCPAVSYAIEGRLDAQEPRCT
ncbi:MAG: radical SAM protein [Nitrospirae bacterium]|nr:radical SAM protein [Nitrospirota bacterium]